MRFAAPLVLLSFLAGCAGPSLAPGTTPPASPSFAPVEAPKVSARETLDALRLFSESYPYRQAGNTMHELSRDWLEREMKAAGLEVLRQDFPSTGGTTGQNIVGIHWGTDRTHWVVVGAHYDVTEGAAAGTYDDGSGTLLTLKLGAAFAKLATDRTFAFIEFDQEERGLIGSKFFVKTVQDGSFAHRAIVDAMIDLDMVGITWPHPADLVCWENSDEIKGLLEDARKAAGVPDANIQYRTPKGGSSDGASFIRAGIPTAYCWSDWDEVVLKDGTQAPTGTSYPWWHQADTYETMMAMAGDEATLQAGFQTTLDIMSPVLARLASPMELDVR